MSRTLSEKHRIYYLLAGVAIAAGILMGRSELVLLSLPFVIMVVYPVLYPAGAEIQTSTQVSECSAFEGETVSVTLSVEAAAAVPLLEVTHKVWTPGQVRADSTRLLLSLRPGETRQIDCRMPLENRGEHVIDQFQFRTFDSAHMVWTEHEGKPGSSIYAYPKLSKLDLPGNVIRQLGRYTGSYVSQAAGEGTELAEIRKYAYGDTAKHINWRTSLKWGELYVNDRLQEKNADVVLVVDTMRDVGHRPDSYLDLVCRGAASIAKHFLDRKDRVGIIEYGGTVSWLRPALGKRQMYRVLGRLAKLSESGSHAFRELDSIPIQALPAKAMLIVFTPLLDKRSTRVLVSLALRGFRPLVVYLSPIELASDVLGDSPSEQLASRWWKYEQRRKVRELRRSGLTVVSWDRKTESIGRVLTGAAAARRSGGWQQKGVL